MKVPEKKHAVASFKLIFHKLAMHMSETKTYGLIGKSLSHSFSQQYFSTKFEHENIENAAYHLWEMDRIDELPKLILETPSLRGLNVTIPFKETVIPYLDDVDDIAKTIGAVNTIKVNVDKKCLSGYNTDFYGFKKSLNPFLTSHHNRALILGSGGASKAICYALKELNIDYLVVSRNPSKPNEISYEDVNHYVLKHHLLIINTTPVGTAPNLEQKPDLPYHELTSQHLLYDLVYNPSETAFLNAGKQYGATTLNGLEMLRLQAEASWRIWNKEA